jgi:hypothetical protein
MFGEIADNRYRIISFDEREAIFCVLKADERIFWCTDSACLSGLRN